MPKGKKKIKTFRNTEIGEALGVDRRTVARLLKDGELTGNTLADVVSYVQKGRTDLVKRVMEVLK